MSHDMTGYAPRKEHVMRHDPAGAAIVIMMRSLKMHHAKGVLSARRMAQAVQDLHEQGSPAFDAAIPMLSQLLKAEMAEREVRSIHCPAVHVYMHGRGLPHEGSTLSGIQRHLWLRLWCQRSP